MHRNEVQHGTVNVQCIPIDHCHGLNGDDCNICVWLCTYERIHVCDHFAGVFRYVNVCVCDIIYACSLCYPATMLKYPRQLVQLVRSDMYARFFSWSPVPVVIQCVGFFAFTFVCMVVGDGRCWLVLASIHDRI